MNTEPISPRRSLAGEPVVQPKSEAGKPGWFERFLLLLIYGVFTVAAWKYVTKWIRYAGVERWPSVEARVTGTSGDLQSYPTQGSWGMKSSHIVDTRAVHFDYDVAGKKYKGDLLSPDGGGFGGSWQDSAWRAYYKPSAPEIAVLIPKPYEGVEAFLWMAFTGIMVAVHLWCGTTDFFQRRRKARETRACGLKSQTRLPS